MIPSLLLPERIRFDFARPRGPVYRGDFTPLIPREIPSLSCIGDVVSSYCAKAIGRARVTLLVVDGKTRRTVKTSPLPDAYRAGLFADRVVNPPGAVSLPAARRICAILAGDSGARLIMVDGEEDMLALPAIACSPPGGIVVYGIPGRGASLIRVDARVRSDASLRLLSLRPGLAPKA